MHADLNSAQAIHTYFQTLMDLKGKKGLDSKEILEKMGSNALPFEAVSNEFRLIENDTYTVYIPWNDGASLVEELKGGARSKSLFRKLSGYSVQIYPQPYKELVDAGDIQVLEGDFAVLTNMSLYSTETGLSLHAEYGKGLFI